MKKVVLLFALFFSCSFYAQMDTLAIVRHANNSFVIPKELKVVYRGLPNELFIDVPNCKSFQVTGNGVIKIAKNLYNLNPGAGLETTLIVDIILNNNKKVTEKHIFKIRNVSSYVTTLNHIEKTKFIVRKSDLNNAIIGVKFIDKHLNFNIQVTGFTLKIPNTNGIDIEGDKINKEAFEKIQKYAKSSDEITISHINVRLLTNDNGVYSHVCIRPSPIVVEIN